MRIWLTIGLLFLLINAKGQSTRISNYNAIGWYAIGGTINIGQKWGLNTEYVWRRTNFITHWQQGIFRIGINNYLNNRLTLRFGYVWGQSFPYGDISINKYGMMFNEHRLVESILLTDKLGSLELSQRFMLEQRWVGNYSSPLVSQEDAWKFMNRLRYMIRLTVPLKKDTEKYPYITVFNELFIGFGVNVGENIFDQNRAGLLFGYRLNKSISVEGGYLSQILELGREVDGKNVFQYNNGFIVSTQFRLYVKTKRQ